MSDDVMYAHTASGSVYTINWTDQTISRDPDSGAAMRKDNEPVKFFELREPVIGKPLEMLLESLSEDSSIVSTARMTSNVVRLTQKVHS